MSAGVGVPGGSRTRIQRVASTLPCPFGFRHSYVGCAGGIRTLIFLFGSQVLFPLSYRA